MGTVSFGSILLTLLFLTPLPALGGEEIYQRLKNSKIVFQPIVTTTEGLRVNAGCARKPKTCAALAAHRRKAKELPKHGLAGHPANDFCSAIHGRPLILTDRAKNQRNFCEFEDGSLIDSWQLYERARGKK